MAQPEPMEQEPRTHWGAVWLCLLGGVVAALHLGKVPAALADIRADLDIGLVAAGFVIALFNLLGMTLGLVIGMAADRLGRRRLIGAGFACLGLGSLLGAVAQGYGVLLFSRFLEGVGFIAAAVALPAVMRAAAVDRDKPFALGVWSTYVPAGMALALVAAPLVIAVTDWRMLWAGIGAISLAAGLAVLRATVPVRLPPPPTGKVWPVMASSLARPGLWLVAIAFGAYAFQWISLMVWLPTFLTEDLGLAASVAALATAFIVVVNVPGNVLGAWLLRRGLSGRGLVVAGSLIMGATGAAVFLPGPGDGARLVLAILFSFWAGLIPPSLFAGAAAQAASPGHLAAANGMLMQGSALGQFLGAPALALAVSLAGGAWSAAAVPMALAALVAVIASKGARPRA